MPDESEDEAGEDLHGSLFDGVEDVSTEFDHTGKVGEFWYPTVDEIIEIHDDIIEEDPDGEGGIENPERIQYAVDYVRHGAMGEKPQTIHEKAFAFMRLIASNHWFVDGNKRTALNTTTLFYFLNGYDLDYGEDLRAMLKLLAVRERLIDRTAATEYLADQTTEFDEETLDLLAVIALAESLLTDVDLQNLSERVSSGAPDPGDRNS